METHITVFRNEAVDALRVLKDSIIIDATVGSGGHTQEIIRRLGKAGCLVGVDADESAIRAAEQVHTCEQARFVVGNFRHIDSILERLGITKVNGIIADLGWRIEQFTEGKRGFSFGSDDPLIMTYGSPAKYPFIAHDIVNEWEQDDLENVIKGYGEERHYRAIAKGIVEARKNHPIATASELAHIVAAAVPLRYRRGKTHPATKTFQALRIAVNDELDAVREFIQKAVALLAPGGRLVIITFHSLEDRIVKQTFKEVAAQRSGMIITKHPIVPTREEQKTNRRSRSAKLRIFEINELTPDNRTVHP